MKNYKYFDCNINNINLEYTYYVIVSFNLLIDTNSQIEYVCRHKDIYLIYTEFY